MMARGMERREIYRDDRDRSHFLELLGEVTARFRLRAHAYVLMDNHYHLLLELGEPNLSRAVQWLNLSYGVWFNRRRERAGYLFQGRFKAALVDPVTWGVGVSAYIHLNPARVEGLGLSKAEQQRAKVWRVEAPSPEVVAERLKMVRNFRWSSYRAYLRRGKGPEWLDAEAVLALLGGRKDDRRENYRKFVEDQLREGASPGAELEAPGRKFFGGEDFLERVREGVAKASAVVRNASGKPELPRWAQKTVAFEEVTRAVAAARGKPWEKFRDQHGDWGRDLALALGRRATNLTLAQLAAATGLKGPAQVATAMKRWEAKMRKNRRMKREAEAIAKTLGVSLLK